MTVNTLDIIGLTSNEPAACAYSTRRLSSAYTGPAFQAYYFSSGQQANVYGDVYFDPTTNTVTPNSMFHPCAGGAAVPLSSIPYPPVVYSINIGTWYDQSGNGQHAKQVPRAGTLNGNRGPSIIGDGTNFFTLNGHIGAFFFCYLPAPTPQTDPLTMLATDSFNTLTDGVSVLVAGNPQTSEGSGGLSNYTFVSKTTSNMPAPFDMYNDSWLLGGPPSGGHSVLENTVIQSDMQISPSSGVGVWGFNADNNPDSNQVIFNNQVAVNKHIDNGNYTYGDQNSQLYIGSRDDQLTGLQGFCTEIIVFPKKHDFTETLQAPINNMLKHWGVTRPNPLTTLGIGGAGQTQATDSILSDDESSDITESLTETPAFTAANTAFSLRKLSSSYSGNAITVTREGDLQTQDISFLSNGLLDISAVKTFCGANKGRVTKWYDQSGSDYHATQSTFANAPLIYDGTRVITQNGQPSLYFDSTSSGGVTNSISLATDPFIGFSTKEEGFTCMVTAALGSQPVGTKFTLVNKVNPSNGIASPWVFFDSALCTSNGSASMHDFYLKTDAKQLDRLGTWLFTSAYNQNTSIIHNGLIQSSATGVGSSYGDVGSPLQIGVVGSARPSYVFNGYISEVVTFPKSVDHSRSDKSALLHAYDHISRYYVDNALAFNGTNNYVELSAPSTTIPLGKSYTIEAWLYVSDLPTGSYQIISSDTSTPKNLWVNSDSKLVASNSDNPAKGDFVSSTIPLNTWFHAAVTYDSPSKVMIMYINVSAVTKEHVKTDSISPEALYLGAKKGSAGNFSNFFKGQVDDLRIWSDVRSASEIRSYQSSLVDPITEGLYYYFLFNQGKAYQDNADTTTLANSCPNVLSNPTVGGKLKEFTLSGIRSNWVKHITWGHAWPLVNNPNDNIGTANFSSNNITYTPSGGSTAATFSGSSSLSLTTPSDMKVANFIISVRVKLSSLPQSLAAVVVFEEQDVSAHNGPAIVIHSDGRIQAQTRQSNKDYVKIISAAGTAKVNQWMEIVVVADSDNLLSCFVDDKLTQSSVEFDGTLDVSSCYYFTVGAEHNGGNGIVGQIDQLFYSQQG